MARTTGPLMSLGASGSVASTLTFSHWKGRPYVRQLVIPANPKSDAQIATRVMMAFLSQTWKSISALNQATWETLASMTKVSPFNAYVQSNMKGWSQFLAPSQANPATRTGTADVISGSTITGGKGAASGAFILATKNQGWGIALQLSTASGPPDTRNTVRLIIDASTWTAGPSYPFEISGLSPGVWNCQFHRFTTDGFMSAYSTMTGTPITVT